MGDKFKNKYRIDTARLKWWDYGWNAAYFVTICTRNREHYFGEIKDGKMWLTNIGKIAQDFWVAIPEHFPFVKLGEFVIMPNHVHGIIIIDKPESDSVETHNRASHNGKKQRKMVETQNFTSKINPTEMGNETNVETHHYASNMNPDKTGSDANVKMHHHASIFKPDDMDDHDMVMMHDNVSNIKSGNINNDDMVQTHNNASNMKPGNINNDDMVETQNFASLPNENPNNHSRNRFGPQSQNLASIIRGYKSAVKKYATLHRIDFAWQSRYYDHIIRDEQSFYRISEYIKNNPVNWWEDRYFE